MYQRLSALAAMIALLAAACSDSPDASLDGLAAQIYSGTCAPDSGQSITVYSGRSENLVEPILDAYACETGTEILTRWGDSNELALLLAEEAEQTPADVFLSRSPGPVGFLESKGLLKTIEPSVLDLVADDSRSSGETWVGLSGRKRVLVYNIDEVASRDLPQSIFELTDERYRGLVAIPATNGSFIDWFTVFRDQYSDDTATQWLDDMVANEAKPYANNRSIVEATSRGEIAMGLVNHYYNYQELAANGDDHRAANHDLADDDIGSLLLITAGTITASSQKAEGANDLLRYLLSAPVQEYFTHETLEYPLAAGIELADRLPPLSALEIGTVDFDSLGGGLERTTAIIEASGILSS